MDDRQENFGSSSRGYISCTIVKRGLAGIGNSSSAPTPSTPCQWLNLTTILQARMFCSKQKSAGMLGRPHLTFLPLRHGSGVETHCCSTHLPTLNLLCSCAVGHNCAEHQLSMHSVSGRETIPLSMPTRTKPDSAGTVPDWPEESRRKFSNAQLVLE
jgi:hypothetical protein